MWEADICPWERRRRDEGCEQWGGLLEEVSGEGNKMGQDAPFSANIAHLERGRSETTECAWEALHHGSGHEEETQHDCS